MVGEQASHPTTAPEQRPFCDDKGCSGWLNKQLEKYKIPEEQLFWVNALNNDGSVVDLAKLNWFLVPREIIALGNVAAEALHNAKLEHTVFGHPQYWKRFKSKEVYPLMEHLSKACL